MLKKILVCESKESVGGIITLSHSYIDGSVSVSNGIICYSISENQIQIEPGYDDGVYAVTYEHLCNDDVSVISSIPKSKSIYKTFSSNESFKANNKYTVNLILGGNDYTKEFHSKFSPTYCTSSKIRNDTGDLLLSIDDVTIYKFIHQNSKVAFEIINTEDDYGTDEEVVITTSVKEYVRYKTDLDLVNSVYLSMTQKYGKVKKSISSLDTEYEHKLPAIKDMLEYFKDKVKEYEDELKSGNSSGVTNFIKAKNTDYPVTARNSF